MADISDWVYAKLAAHAGTAALVGTRIYPVQLPQTATPAEALALMPAVVFQLVTEDTEHAFGADPGVAHGTFQVSSWATTHNGARALAKQVKAALRRATGTAAGVTVQCTLKEMELDAYDDGPRRYRVDQDYRISYEEP